MHQKLKNQLIQLLSLLLCYWGLNLKTSPVAAQSITATPDGTGTIINHNGNTYNIQGGTSAGENLFHSFTEFGLDPQEVANFLSLPEINNILGRVTGGNASVIQGLIQVTGGNSNLYLMNPAGWVFHQGASLDVPGSFGVTTATRMGFENGYFNASGDNLYSNLTGNPTSLIFDQNNPSWIINEADLAVEPGASLWAVGGGIVSTGTITAEGGEVTLAAVPGNNQVRLSHEGMVLNLVLDAAPVGGNNSSVTGIQSVDIPRYLTGGSDEGHANYAIVEDDGSVRLVNRETVIEDGDVVIAGEVTADEITLMAAGRVKPTDYDLVSSHPVVVLFPEEIGDNLETTFIDAGINDYQGEDAYQAFLYGGKPGTISQIVAHEEGEGISTVTRMLAAIANQGGRVSGIHLLTEGNEGNFWLGRDYVDSENIGEYQQELEQWKGALTAGADILLYSCFTALGVTGEQLINSLADYTGADVAASTDLTGSEALGGNWDFEVTTGEIETGLGFESQVLADFTGKLAAFDVGNAADLIDAIEQANMNAEADTINLTADITLMGMDNNTDGLNGLPSIDPVDGSKLTINGMGNTIARDAGAMDNFRVLHIAAGAELEVNNTTIFGGLAARAGIQGAGGGIFNRGTLTLNNSTVSGSTANNRGGGIFNFGNGANAATVTLNNNSTVSGNTAVFGGGIFNRGEAANAATITLNNSTVSGNTANNRGGGILNRGNGLNAATVALNNSTVSGNMASYDGGGILNRGDAANAATVNLDNSTVSDNTSNNRGGGIFNDGRNGLNAATVTLSNNSLVSGNTATNNGGGIYNSGYNGVNAATITLTDSMVSGNTATMGNGGGIYNYGDGANAATVDLNNSTVSDNTAYYGGGIFNSGANGANAATVDLNNSTVSGNRAYYGGGIFNSGANGANAATVTLSNNSTVSGNFADYGGGIYNSGNNGADAATVTLDDSTVSGNTAIFGGGILNSGNGADSATVTLSDSIVSGNTAIFGGGILNSGNGADSATVTLSDSTVSENTADYGGGIYNSGNGANNSATVTLDNSTVSGNTANLDGGGILNYGYEANAATVTLSNSTVSGNSAGNIGGGIRNLGYDYENAATVTLSNSTVSGNSAGNIGGGIDNEGSLANNAATVTLSNSTVSGNSATYGGGIYNYGYGANAATVTLSNSTVSGNTGTYGGGIYNYGYGANAATVAVGNSIVAGNTATNSDPDVGRNDPNFAPITDNGNNLIGSDSLGVFTTSTLVGTLANPLDPRLTPLGNYGGSTQTHALLPDSPAIDGGSNALAAGLITDQRGATRIINIVDIGAVEVQGFTLSAVAGSGQSTIVNTGFATDLQVKLTEDFIDAPLAGATITLTSLGTGASANFGSTTVTTDNSGIATTTATANTIAGNYQVAANANGVTGVNFELTNNPGAAAILSILAGNNQNTTVNTAFATSLQVQVTDKFGNVIPGVIVTLSPPGTGASANLGSLSISTDNNGIATALATANTVAGEYQLGANVTGATGVNFELTNNPGAAHTLIILAGNNQSTIINTAFANSLQVQVTDEFGNAVPGVTVTFILPNTGAGASLGSISLTTDASGLASTTAIANSIVGSYQLGASIIGITEVNFNLTNTAFDITPILQSVLNELPEYGLEEYACQTAPAIAINATGEETPQDEEEERETTIQRNQDCQTVGAH
ncbi:MAG: DUF4347 domain-containing protein [Symploca sp. SIO2E6]|nr:DUF4347 domain-containing protein [Symploca sp. SIO2E6]